MELLTKNQTYIQKSLWGIQTGCLGGPAWGTEPNSTLQLLYLGIQYREYYFGLI